MKKNLFIILLTILFITTNATAAIIFTESFERPNPYSSFTTINSGGTVGAFNIVSESIDWIGTYWQAADGHDSLDMNGSSSGPLSGSISYNLSTIAGTTYDLHFSMAGNPSGDIKTLNVTAGSTFQQFTFDTANTNKDNMGWETKTLSFTATSAISPLIFTDLFSRTNSGSALDNIVVSTKSSEVPEPASLMLLFSGILGLMVSFKKRS